MKQKNTLVLTLMVPVQRITVPEVVSSVTSPGKSDSCQYHFLYTGKVIECRFNSIQSTYSTVPARSHLYKKRKEYYGTQKLLCSDQRCGVAGQQGNDDILYVLKKYYKESFKTIKLYDMHVNQGKQQIKPDKNCIHNNQLRNYLNKVLDVLKVSMTDIDCNRYRKFYRSHLDFGFFFSQVYLHYKQGHLWPIFKSRGSSSAFFF